MTRLQLPRYERLDSIILPLGEPKGKLIMRHRANKTSVNNTTPKEAIAAGQTAESALMQIVLMRCGLAILIVLGMTILTSAAELDQRLEPLAVQATPEPEPLSAKWKDSILIYAEDFERSPDGAYPGRWKIRTTNWKPNDDPSRFLVVRSVGPTCRRRCS